MSIFTGFDENRQNDSHFYCKSFVEHERQWEQGCLKGKIVSKNMSLQIVTANERMFAWLCKCLHFSAAGSRNSGSCLDNCLFVQIWKFTLFKTPIVFEFNKTPKLW